MTDVHTREQRSRNMAAIRHRNTKPERLVRNVLTKMGHRYRLNYTKLPGKPDIVFVSRRKAIFVHGCFWHCHDCFYGRKTPKQNAQFWAEKRRKNVERDRVKQTALATEGFDILVIWACETKNVATLSARLTRFLGRGA